MPKEPEHSERPIHESEIAKNVADAEAATALAEKHRVEAAKFAAEAKVSEIEAEVDGRR